MSTQAAATLSGSSANEIAEPASEKNAPETNAPLNVQSSAFAEGQAIPRRYTCQGEDIAPPLSWSGTPAEAETLALIVDDPDAPKGTWVHWVVYNIPAGTTELPEDAELPAGARQGRNSWERTDYGGPCPPSGSHRYFFKLYALDAELDLEKPTKQEFVDAMTGHVLSRGELMGTYEKR